MAKIEDISAQSFQFTEVVTPTAPSSGRIKLYAKSDHGLYKQSSDGTETLLVPDTRFKGLRLAKRVIVPEGTPPPIIEIDKYEDGTPLNSTLGGELLFYSGTNASITASTFYLQINNVSNNEYWDYNSEANNSIKLGIVGSLYSKNRINIDVLNQNIFFGGIWSYRHTNSGNFGTYGGGMTTPQSSITKIKLFLSSGTFPTGTIVEWWERG